MLFPNFAPDFKFKKFLMVQIERFVFNNFMVNTYLLYDETGECIVIDAACYEEQETMELASFLENKNLKLVRNLNTHCHIDHVLGNDFIFETYRLRPEYHKNSVPFFHTAKEIGSSFGFKIERIPDPLRFIEDGEEIRWGNSSLTALFTPGHAEGSLCFYNQPQGFVITGDVLFKDTIGRTDLPSGDFDQLMRSIKTKLFTLPGETIVYPGHGPETSIGYEMENNQFIR
jgi:glyoxylase-like metal-dependent hydrolase (beta-lactamase superfamily II)